MISTINHIDFVNWVASIKLRIKSTQIKAAIAINTALIKMYWDIGKEISLKTKENEWGSNVVESLSLELKKAFPNVKGFSRSNLFSMKKFYEYYIYHVERHEKIQQVVGQIPWGHNVLIISRLSNVEEALYYVDKTILNGWSRSVLLNQIDSKLFEREGRALNNFDVTLSQNKSLIVKEVLKDPYNFDFIEMKEKADERSIENQLVKNIASFLLELGKGFAFLGQQYHLLVDQKDYYIDLMFYHVLLKCYVVVELKIGEFKPEYAGKLNFYLSAVDDTLKTENDSSTIGLLLCKTKSRIEAEYTLRGLTQPIGIAEFEFEKIAKQKIESELPSIEELENELSKL